MFYQASFLDVLQIVVINQNANKLCPHECLKQSFKPVLTKISVAAEAKRVTFPFTAVSLVSVQSLQEPYHEMKTKFTSSE